MSMATHGARRLGTMAENAAGIVAIELLAAAQGIHLREPLRTSPRLEAIVGEIRRLVPPHDDDRFLAPDIEAVKGLVRSGAFNRHAPDLLPSLGGSGDR